MTAHSKLLIVAAADVPLTPAQRKFNQLVRKIGEARGELLAWQEQAPLFAQAHARRVRPLLKDLAGCRHAVVVKLDALLAQGRWTKAECATMRGMVCEVAAMLIEDEATEDAVAAELKALHDKHAQTDFDTGNRAAMAAMKSLFETMSGVPLGDDDFESEKELISRARERLHASRDGAAPAEPPRGKRQTAQQRRREAEAQQATKSVRDVFRKLVSALHPDRASDAADLAQRTALMQRVNRAYETQDLLALFALQLEIEQVDATHLAQATAERAHHYNQVLAAQLRELKAEVEAREIAFCMQFGIDIELRLLPHKLGKLLHQQQAELAEALAEARLDLRRLDDPAAARRWLKQMRQEHQAFGNECPF